MNLARLLFKPKWQDKNPAVRRAAVAANDDADLIAALPHMVRADADAGVRLAALRRLNDYEAWRERSTGDADADLRRNARTAYLALLCSNGASAPALSRRIAELDTLSAEEIEKVATSAADRELRGAALERVKRPALIAERAVADADAAIRMAALERVADASALERIAERARKTDKAVSRRARELLATRRIDSGDAGAIAQQARRLCEQMEALMRAPASDAAHATIASRWRALGNAIPTELIARYVGADALVRQTRINAQNPQIHIAASPPASELDAATESATIASIDADRLAAQARFDAALAHAAAAAQRERELRRVHLREIEEVLPAYAAAIDSGAVSAAHAPHDRLLNLTAMVVPLPAAIEAKLAPLHEQYLELKQQQQWANRQRRDMLCEDVERLTQSGLHPDALATRVREAREEWRRLDVAEGLAGNAESATSRRFQALCQQALKPAKTYFDKRTELRRSHAQEIDKLLQEFADLPEPIADWKSAGTLRQKLGEALRSLDAVDPRERTPLAKRLKDAIGLLAPRLDAHADDVAAAKQRLIERAMALQQQNDGRSVARDARDLQQQWTALGNGRRGSDQRLWNEFRAALDAAFGKLDASRKERDAQAAAALAQVQGVLEEIEALRADAAQSPDSIRPRLRDLAARWQAAANTDRALEARYRSAHEAIATQLQEAARRKRLARFVAAMEKYTLLRSLETGTAPAQGVADQWQAVQLPDSELDAALDARYARVADATSGQPADEAAARDRLVELEFLAGIDTPGDDRARRMNHQVQRLASRMRDRVATTPEAELAQLLAAWFGQNPQSAELELRFAHATHAAIASLP